MKTSASGRQSEKRIKELPSIEFPKELDKKVTKQYKDKHFAYRVCVGRYLYLEKLVKSIGFDNFDDYNGIASSTTTTSS